jgi:hypothetical protein
VTGLEGYGYSVAMSRSKKMRVIKRTSAKERRKADDRKKGDLSFIYKRSRASSSKLLLQFQVPDRS